MDFNWAIKKLKEGKKVRREHHDWYVELIKVKEGRKNSGYSFFHFKGIKDNDEFDREQRSSLEDFEATDWEIYDDSKDLVWASVDELKLTETVNIFGKDFETFPSPDFLLVLSNLELYGKKAYDIYKKNNIVFQEDIQEHLDKIFNSENEKEETLSDKIWINVEKGIDGTIKLKDLKEAVRKLKLKLFQRSPFAEFDEKRWGELVEGELNIIKEIFGDKLI